MVDWIPWFQYRKVKPETKANTYSSLFLEDTLLIWYPTWATSAKFYVIHVPEATLLEARSSSHKASYKTFVDPSPGDQDTWWRQEAFRCNLWWLQGQGHDQSQCASYIPMCSPIFTALIHFNSLYTLYRRLYRKWSVLEKCHESGPHVIYSRRRSSY